MVVGLWAGLLIGYITEYYTSNKYSPVLQLIESCRMGAAPNIILGLALGYMSTIIPIFSIAITVYVCFSVAGMYGVALGALECLAAFLLLLQLTATAPSLTTPEVFLKCLISMKTSASRPTNLTLQATRQQLSGRVSLLALHVSFL